MKVLLLILTTVSALQKFSINFTKAKTKFCLSLHYNHDDSYLFVNGKEICKADNKNVNFPTQFYLGSTTVSYIHLVLLILKKFLLKEMCIMFQLITMLLINLTF